MRVKKITKILSSHWWRFELATSPIEFTLENVQISSGNVQWAIAFRMSGRLFGLPQGGVWLSNRMAQPLTSDLPSWMVIQKYWAACWERV